MSLDDNIVRATHDWYDRHAGAYATRNADYDRFPGLQAEIRRFLESIRLIHGPVLDLGCGAGRDARFFIDGGRETVAADLSGTMLHITQAALEGSSRSHCVQLDMRQLPFARSSFSGAWACGSLLHVPRIAIADCVGELHRVLAPNARLAVSMKSGNHSGWVVQPFAGRTLVHAAGTGRYAGDVG